jgi:hypothetical protein
MALRRICLPVFAAALAALCVAAVAQAANHARLGGKITPVIRGLPTRPQPAELSISLGFTSDEASQASVLQRAIIFFPYGSQLNGKLFPSCTAAALADHGKSACPKGSLIGKGTALGTAGDIREKITVSLYNGKGGKNIVFYLQGTDPVKLNVPWESPLQPFSSGKWNFKLTVDVPESLQRIVGLDVGIEDFSVKVDAKRKVKGRTRGYIETLICPPGALVPLEGIFSFIDAPSITQDSFLSCG